MRTSAIGLNASITHLTLPTTFSHVFDPSIGTTHFMDSSACWRSKRVMLTVMYSMTGCVDRAASPPSFSRIQGISTREVFNYLNERGLLNKTNHFEKLRVSASYGSPLGRGDVEIASHKETV